jgi:ribose-phosphate pyrophosphokinase
MEIILMVDALKRASAGRITAAIPYFGYARQDRRPRSARVAISAKVVANMLEKAGVERVLIMDLHADQIQGFFDIPVDNIYASPILLGDLVAKNYDDLLVVSPDVGGVVRARALAKRLNCDLAIIDKRRPKANVSEVMHVIGEIDGRNCVIMDDMIDTAGTLVKAAEVLKERGANLAVRPAKAQLRRPAGGVARRRRRGARPRAGQAPRLRPGDHRQAPPEGERVGSDEHHR